MVCSFAIGALFENILNPEAMEMLTIKISSKNRDFDVLTNVSSDVKDD